ncbi:MAG: hypothetical protein COB69_09105 [Phycisphaera sp.]|nr:MAG: hypothetical protein COB69_09105 [Phycisphaera sp.]
MNSQNHIAQALVRLRRGVTICAAGVFVAALIQLFVFGFVHFTDVRFQTIQDPSPTQHRTVVVTPTSNTIEGESRGRIALPTLTIEETVDLMSPKAAPDPNKVNSTAGVILKKISQGAIVVGIFSAVGLAVLTLLGAVVAGGASVPGVEKAVSACMWGLGLCVLALPWQDVFTSMPFAGVFASYQNMTAASDGATMPMQVLLLFVGVPAAVMAGAMVTGLRFGSGVEHGIMANQAPPPMDAVDREMAHTRENLSTHRQLGSVHNSFTGDTPAAPTESVGTISRQRSTEPPARRRSPLSGSQNESQQDYKRPI